MIDVPTTVDVPLRTDEHGVIRVGNTRVTLLTLISRYRMGDTPEMIHEAFPTVSLADIYAVIAYYLAHQASIDAYIQQIEAESDRQRQEHEANDPKAAAFNAKMRALLAEKRKSDEA